MCVTSTRGCKLTSGRDSLWSDDQLLDTATRYGGAGDDANQPEDVRFLRGVAKVVKRRLKTDDLTDQPAVFLLNPTVPDDLDVAFDLFPMLDNGRTSITGRLWFVSPVVISGQCTPLDCQSDAAMFQIVVETYALGDVPAVIYDPRVSPPEVRYYPDGLGQPNTCHVTRVISGDIDLPAVLEVVERVYLRQLITPDAQSQRGKLWKNRSLHWVSENAELTIQMYLETAFNQAFPTCTIRSEQPQVSGRLDIEIEEADFEQPGHFIRHALLELKVLRSFGSTGNAVSARQVGKWIDEGVDQAFAYRVDRGTLHSALCCFDMRREYSGTECFEKIKRKAEKLDVGLSVWHLFGSAKAYRAHLALVASGG